MNKKFRNSLLAVLSVLTVGTAATACATTTTTVTTEKGPDYNFTYDAPLRAESDSFMNIDGKLDEEAWANQNYLYWVGNKGNEIKATTLFTSKGLYVGVRAVDANIRWTNRYAFNENCRFKIQVVQEDEINYNDNRGNIHPTRQFWFDIDAKTSLSRMERQYDAASYYEGELNGKTEYLSAELFFPWSEMGYTEDELNEAGVPNAVKLLIQYWSPSGHSGFPGFTDDDRFSSYYTYDANGSTCYVDRYSETDTIGYSTNGWTPGDKWVVDEENKTATNTADRTQILWFRKDVNGNNDSTGTHYIASAKVKAIKKQGMYPHVGLMTLSSKTMFNIYGVATDGLAGGMIGVSAAQATDGGQWVATKKFSYTYSKNYTGVPDGSDLLPEGMTLAADEVYLTVVKRGGELYYFVNGEYIGMEYDERVSGECVIGIFANGQTVVSDWSFEDFSDRTAELDTYLNGFLWFLSGQDNGGGYVVIDRLVSKHGESINARITPKPGYVLSRLTINGEDKYQYFIDNADNNATLSYVPDDNLHIAAVFEKLPKTGVKDIFFELYDADKTDVKLLGASYTIRGNDKRFVYTGTVNNKGNIVGSLLQAGTHTIAGESVTIDGNYTIEINCNGYVTKTFSFSLPADFAEEELATKFYLDAYPYGDVTVNGTAVTTTNYNLYTYSAVGTNEYVTKEQGTGNAYLRDAVYNGNFIFNGSVSLESNALYNQDDPTNIWKCGAVVGYIFNVGKYYVQMKTTAWKPGWIYINYNGGTELGLNNFPTSTGSFKNANDSWELTVARYNDVIYVYNSNGELGFTLSKSGLELVNSAIVEGSKNLDAFNTGMKNVFGAGTQTAIGMYRVQSTEGGGVYKYAFTHTNSSDALNTQFAAANVTLKADETYSLAVESKYEVEGGYLKDTNVTTVFTNIPSRPNYVAVVEFVGGETIRLFGTYDKKTATFKTTFPLSSNATVWLEEYDFGIVNVNDVDTVAPSGLMLTKNDDGTYGSEFNQTGGLKQYHTGKTTKGDYLLDATVTVADQAPTSGGGPGWAFGSGVGFMISAGGNKELTFFTNSWEGDRMLINYGGTNGATVKITGFPRDGGLKAVGNQFNFKVLRYNDVFYFYNCKNELIFHVTDMGIVIDSATSTSSGSPVAQDLIRTTFESILKAGDENVIGIYREYVPKSEGAYDWDIDIEAGENIIDDYKATVSLRAGEAYTMTVEKGIAIEGEYLKGPITAKFSNVPAPVNSETYMIAYPIDGETRYVKGAYDATTSTFTVTFPLTADAEVWLEEYVATASSATVNGSTIEGIADAAYKDPASGKFVTTATGLGFLPNKSEGAKATGNFIVDFAMQGGNYNSEFRIYTAPDAWIAFTAIDGGYTAGNDGIYFYTDGANVTNATSSWFTEVRLNGNPNVFTNPNIRGVGAVGLRIVNFNKTLYLFSNTYWDSTANAVAKSNQYTLLCAMPSDATNPVFYNGMNFGEVNSWQCVRESIKEIFAAATSNEFAFGIKGVLNTDFTTSVALEDDDTAVYNFLANNASFKEVAVGVNGEFLTRKNESHWTQDANGCWNESGTDNTRVKLLDSASGDYMFALKLKTSWEMDFRIYSSTTQWITFMTYKDQNSLFMQNLTTWATETIVGTTDSAKFYTEYNNTAEGGDGYLDLMFVRYSNELYIYSCETLSGNAVATSTNWKLFMKIAKDGTATYGDGIARESSNGFSGFTTGVKTVMSANDNVFAFRHRNGTQSGKIVVVDDDAKVAAFMAGNKPVATYAKA